jgi:hypothetical protein
VSEKSGDGQDAALELSHREEPEDDADGKGSLAEPGSGLKGDTRKLPVGDEPPEDSKADIAKDPVGLAAVRHRTASWVNNSEALWQQIEDLDAIPARGSILWNGHLGALEAPQMAICSSKTGSLS